MKPAPRKPGADRLPRHAMATCMKKATESFVCEFCQVLTCSCAAAGDVITRYLGTICNRCSLRLPGHVHEAAERYDLKNGGALRKGRRQ